MENEKVIEYKVYDSHKSAYVFFRDGQYIQTNTPPQHLPFITILQFHKLAIDNSEKNDYDFFLKQGLISSWFGDVELTESNNRFACGQLIFATSPFVKGDLVFAKQGEYELLKWMYDGKKYENNLQQIDYFEFVELVKTIPEFKNEDYYHELSVVDAMHGFFLKLPEKGIACVQMVGLDFIYVSYLGVVPLQRGSDAAENILHGLFNFANTLKKDILVAVTEPKIRSLYTKNGFQNAGFWKEVK